MPRVGFEPTIPVFERAKTVHALDRAVTMVHIQGYTCNKYRPSCKALIKHVRSKLKLK
jgi:hypothetical protein